MSNVNYYYSIRRGFCCWQMILFLLTMYACSEKADNTTVTTSPILLPRPRSSYYEMFKVDYTDTTCLSELKKARRDVQKGKLVYVSAFDGSFQRYDDELKELLDKQHIIYEPIGENCTGYNLCYGHYMDSVIIKRYGSRFLDSMRREADQLYLSSWATKTYSSFGVDMEPDYCPMQPEAYILSKLQLPKSWDEEPIKNERQYIMLNVLVDSTGSVASISFDTASNLKKSNRKHRSYFKKEVTRIIHSMGQWQPATVNNHRVKCWQFIDINLDN